MAIDARCHRRQRIARFPVLPLTWLSAGTLLLAGHAVHAQVAPPTGDAAGAVGAAGAQASGSGGAPRSPWRFQPSISIDETYSDNVNLSPKGSERSDLITTITPGLRITRFGPWLTLNVNYSPSLLIYARGSNGSYVRNNLDAVADATLVQNLLYFNARAAIAQQNISPFGTQAAGTVNGSTNSTETRSYALGPTLRSRFGNDLSYSAGYQYASTGSDTSAYDTNHTSTLFGSFESGTSTRNLGYNANYSRTDQDYGSNGKIITESINNGLSYLVSPTIRFRANIGYDRNQYPTSGREDLKGLSYSAGGQWNPSQHTALSALLGHRYFGPTANVTFTNNTARTAVSLSYTRDQRTSSGAGLTPVANPTYNLIDSLLRTAFPDPAQRAAAVQGFLASSGQSTSPYLLGNFLSNQIFLEKSLQASLALVGLRNTVTINAYRTESQSLSNLQVDLDVFNQAQSFRQTGYGVTWSHKLGPRTTANASITKTRSVALVGTGDTNARVAQVLMTRQLSQRLSATVSLRNIVQSGNGGNAAGNFYGGNYRENQIRGSLFLTF